MAIFDKIFLAAMAILWYMGIALAVNIAFDFTGIILWCISAGLAGVFAYIGHDIKAEQNEG